MQIVQSCLRDQIAYGKSAFPIWLDLFENIYIDIYMSQHISTTPNKGNQKDHH